MSIPFWRYLDYTSDGCDLTECLSCYRRMEGRSGPDREAMGGGYRFCPYCGIQWEGQHQYDDEIPYRRAIARAPDARPENWALESRAISLTGSEPRLLRDWTEETTHWNGVYVLGRYKDKLRDEAEEAEDCGFSHRDYRIVRLPGRNQVLPKAPLPDYPPYPDE